MKFIITGRKFDVTDGLRERIHKKLGKLGKFFNEDTEAYVTLKVERNRQIVEVTIPFNGVILRGEEEHDDMYVAIDRVVDVLERQIEKYKYRLGKRIKGNVVSAGPNGERVISRNGEAEEEIFKIVKIKRFAIKPMDVEEAILQMNLLGHQFFVFSNADTEDVNVIYKRKDGNYGLIEPEY